MCFSTSSMYHKHTIVVGNINFLFVCLYTCTCTYTYIRYHILYMTNTNTVYTCNGSNTTCRSQYMQFYAWQVCTQALCFRRSQMNKSTEYGNKCKSNYTDNLTHYSAVATHFASLYTNHSREILVVHRSK